MKSKTIMVALVLFALVIVSGCAQAGQKTMPTPTSAASATPTISPQTPAATADPISSGLSKSDTLATDATEPSLDNLASDLGAVENGL